VEGEVSFSEARAIEKRKRESPYLLSTGSEKRTRGTIKIRQGRLELRGTDQKERRKSRLPEKQTLKKTDDLFRCGTYQLQVGLLRRVALRRDKKNRLSETPTRGGEAKKGRIPIPYRGTILKRKKTKTERLTPYDRRKGGDLTV